VSGRQREGQSHDPGPHRRATVAEHGDGTFLGGTDRGDELGKREPHRHDAGLLDDSRRPLRHRRIRPLRRSYLGVGRFLLRIALRVLREQPSEFELGEEPAQLLGRGWHPAQLAHGQGQHHIVAKPDKFARQRQLRARLGDGLALLAFDLLDVRQHAVERAVGRDELRRGLGPDARDAGDIVDRVAHEREQVAELLGENAPFLFDLGRAQQSVFHGVEELHILGAQLHEILVGRADHNRQILALAARTSVAMTSSASTPGSESTLYPKASATWWARSICAMRSGGVGGRLAL
jgi:hypothetical protein